jgi:outer membrane immunogenic protein
MRTSMMGAAAALLLMTSGAVADGISRRPAAIAAPAYEPPPTWSGFYLGAGIGAGAVVHDVSVHDRVLDERLFSFDGGHDGVLGTLIVGWDWQIGSNAVFGVFADYDFTDFSSRHRAFDNFHHSTDHNNVWSIGARLGWLSSPSTLWYVTGGYTQVDLDHSGTFEVAGLTVSRDRTLDGYFLGAGVDTRLAASNWFLRLEYRFSDFNSGGVDVSDDVNSFRVSTDPEAHTARLTLTYKFPGGAWSGWGLGR